MGSIDFESAKLSKVFGECPEGSQELIKEISEGCPKYIPTGFKTLDGVLNGGLTPSLYVLGAMPSLGKSTFLINMAEKIASGEADEKTGEGIPVLYFSLEMPREYIARLILCHSIFGDKLTDKKTKRDKLEHALTNTPPIHKFLNREDAGNIGQISDEAFERYRKTSENIFIIERSAENKGFTVDDISEYTETFKSKFENFVLIVDYLQLLRSSNEAVTSERSIVDNNISGLWTAAHTLNIPIIAISSINRTSYDESIGLASFKESGGIEFSADVVWGLQYAGIGVGKRARGDDKFNIDKAMGADPRLLDLKVLKNRYGKSGIKLAFKFHTTLGLYLEDHDREKAEKEAEKMSDAEETKPAVKTRTRKSS